MSSSESLQIDQPQGAALIACAGFLYDQIPLAERARTVTDLLRLVGQRNAVVVSAQDHQRLVAAVAAQLAPGKQAFVQPPKMVAAATDQILDRLWRALEDELKQRDVDYLQAILPADADPTLLQHVGMQAIASLSFLTAETREAETRGDSEPSAALTYEPFDETQAVRMKRLIESTYADSADCPAVEGMRKIDDVIEGYRAAGQFDPTRWFFVRRDDRDLGCLLLTDHPASSQFELVYMGLVVEARGRGLGVEMTKYAKAVAAAARRERIFVAVDTSNTPAIQTYTRSGFALLQQQQVLAKVLAS